MSLINVDAKILNKILANQIQRQIKWIIYHDHIEFIPESQRWFSACKVTWCTTSTKDKNCMITSINTEKGFEKIQHPFLIKTLTKVGTLLLLLLLSHFSHVRLCATPEMAAHQAPLSLRFSRQEHWSGLPFPSIHESEKWKRSCSFVLDSYQPHGLLPTRLLHPWDFPCKSTGVGCHCLLQSGYRGDISQPNKSYL